MFTILVWACGQQGTYFELAWEELLCHMARERVDVATWLRAIHSSATEQGLVASAPPLKLPDWLFGVTMAGSRIETETSTNPAHNKLLRLLEFRTGDVASDLAILSPSTFAGVDVACCLVRRHPGTEPATEEAAGSLSAGIKCYTNNLGRAVAMDNAKTASFDNAYSKLKAKGGGPSTLRQAAQHRVEACRRAGLHFITLVVAVPGHTTTAAAELLRTERLRPGVNVDDAGDVRVVVTLQTLVAAFSCGDPGLMAGVVRGVLALAAHATSVTGFSEETRAAVRKQLDDALATAAYEAEWLADFDNAEAEARAWRARGWRATAAPAGRAGVGEAKAPDGLRVTCRGFGVVERVAKRRRLREYRPTLQGPSTRRCCDFTHCSYSLPWYAVDTVIGEDGDHTAPVPASAVSMRARAGAGAGVPSSL